MPTTLHALFTSLTSRPPLRTAFHVLHTSFASSSCASPGPQEAAMASCSPSKCATCPSACGSGSASNGTGDNAQASQDGLQSAGDLEAQLQAALQRAQKAEQAFEKLKSENAQRLETHDHKSENGVKLQPLRSQQWFNNPHNPGMTALYLERYLNFGLTMPEINDPKKPIIGIAQTGSDLSPCNRHHLVLAKRVRAGIIAAGGTPMEFPCHPIQETGKRPTAALDRNLAYLSLVEVLYGYPLDGVVLLSGCDKTTPALVMAAATVNIPAIVMNVGPMLNGYSKRELVGSGTVVWAARKKLASAEIDYSQFLDVTTSSAPSVGHCNTLGTASTMNALAEALGMALPGSSAIPAPYRERGQCSYETGLRIVDMVREDLKPSDIMTREAFENAIVVNTAIGGSTNAAVHLIAMAKHVGVPLTCDDWENVGYKIPLLLNVQPAGEWLCEEYHRAGGLPSVMAELISAGLLPHPDVKTANGRTMRDNCEGKVTWDPRVIKTAKNPVMQDAGFLHLRGNLFDSAIMKTSVISKNFRDRFLSNPDDPMAFEGPVAVWHGPEHYHDTIEDKPTQITENTILVMIGAGPIGYPGSAEVANIQPPGELIKAGITELPTLSDGRQSGTSASPSILHASPEAALNSNLALLKNGDIVRVDLNKRTVNVKLSDEELKQRRKAMGGFKYPDHQTPWQKLYREQVSQLNEGMVLQSGPQFQRIAQAGVPRDNH